MISSDRDNHIIAVEEGQKQFKAWISNKLVGWDQSAQKDDVMKSDEYIYLSQILESECESLDTSLLEIKEANVNTDNESGV